MAATLSIIGHDDIGIVTNITSIINKEKSTSLRNISINSNDGLFQGYVVVGISSTEALTSLMKKIKDIKGVKDVTRADSAAATSVNQSNNKAKVKKK
jgi:GTP pyrophosphokinase